MARRVGSVDEFEFKAIGENHDQGVRFYGSHILPFGGFSYFIEHHGSFSYDPFVCHFCLTFLFVYLCTKPTALKFNYCQTSACRGWQLRSWSQDLSLRRMIL